MEPGTGTLYLRLEQILGEAIELVVQANAERRERRPSVGGQVAGVDPDAPGVSTRVRDPLATSETLSTRTA